MPLLGVQNRTFRGGEFFYMKHNPRLNEKMARLPGFADIHPLQPVSTVRARWR